MLAVARLAVMGGALVALSTLSGCGEGPRPDLSVYTQTSADGRTGVCLEQGHANLTTWHCTRYRVTDAHGNSVVHLYR